MASELFLSSVSLLDQIAKDVDITKAQFESAERAYKSVGDWLLDENSPISKYMPLLYPHGSMQLGTVVKPRPDKDEYDVDLACELQLLSREQLKLLMPEERSDTSKLKKMVGDRLNSHQTYKSKLTERNRCWTLEYADSAQFHMDILPAIPDAFLRVSPRATAIGPGSLLITDKRVPDWLQSNPSGFAEWFDSRMKIMLENIMKSLKLSSIKEIPYHERKTPLQKSIQILKRNRDEDFGGNEFKPTSVIITTLAAHAYKGENNLYDALEQIVNTMDQFIGTSSGRPSIMNPVNDGENFADKWHRDSRFHKTFSEWLDGAREFIRSLATEQRPKLLMEKFERRFGARLTKSAAAESVPDLYKSVYVSTPHVIIPNSTRGPWKK